VTKSVTAVVVTYNSARYIRECLASVRASDTAITHLVVVDNASSDETLRIVERDFPEAEIIRNEGNFGFAVATNAGIRHRPADFTLLLNPDAILEPATLGSLLEHMAEEPDTAIAGPRLLNDDGTLQFSIGRFPTLFNQVGRLLFLHRLFPRSVALQELDFRVSEYTYSHDAEWLFGAVLLVRSEATDWVGLLDEDYFLFSEEQDWCLRMRSHGWRVTYVAEATATHLGRGGVGAPEVFVHLLRSKHTFIRKNYGDVAALLARMLLFVGLSVRYAGSVILGRLGPNSRSSSLSHAYALGIRWALTGRRTS